MNKTIACLSFVAISLLMCACSSVSYKGSSALGKNATHAKFLLIPLDNATDSEAASTALTEMTASALQAKGIAYVRMQERQPPVNAETNNKPTWLDYAKENGFTHLLRGTVTEYHYKTDLDGDPAVGLSMHIINVETGETQWQASSSATGFGLTSLSEAGQRAANKLVANIFVSKTSR